MLRCKQQSIGEQAGSAVERAFGADPGKLREIIAFRQVPQHNVSCLAIVLGFEISGACLVGKVADAREDALLDGPGVGTIAEHLKIVIGLQIEKVD